MLVIELTGQFYQWSEKHRNINIKPFTKSEVVRTFAIQQGGNWFDIAMEKYPISPNRAESCYLFSAKNCFRLCDSDWRNNILFHKVAAHGYKNEKGTTCSC